MQIYLHGLRLIRIFGFALGTPSRHNQVAACFCARLFVPLNRRTIAAMTTLFRKFLPAAVAVLLFFTLAALYFAPQFGGDVLPQHDVRQYEGASREIHRTREAYGEDPQWIGSMFGGMPAYLVDVRYPAQLVKDAAVPLTRAVPIPAGLIFFAMCAFWVMLRMMKIDPWVGIVPSLAYGLSTYFLLIIGAGHLTKMWALVYAPPMMGGIWMTLRGRSVHGALRFARNRRQPSADHLLFPAGGRLVLAQRRHRRLAGETLETLRQTYGGAGGRRAAGARFELRTAVVHRPAREGYHAQRFGTGGRGCRERRAGSGLCDGVELRPCRELEPADPRFHGQRLGPRLLGGRPRRRGVDALRHGAGGAAASRLLGRTALHRRAHLSGRRGALPGVAGGAARRRPRPLVDRGGEPRHAAAGVGASLHGIDRTGL